MYRSKNIILVSHCMLNYNSKVENTSAAPDVCKDVMLRLLELNIGIIQLPCPELCQLGIKRWGHVREQLDTPFFRKRCRDLFEPYVEQMQNYIENGYNLMGIVGINGSPSCGVEFSCSGTGWGGEFADLAAVGRTVAAAKLCSSKGIFIEEIEKLLDGKALPIKIVGIDEGDPAFSIKQLEILTT